jgi:nucleoside 2-deoxyribosyltransferase
LFSEAEKAWHRAFKARLEAAGYDVLWPGDLFPAGGAVTAAQIMEADRDALLSCDVVVALLDGAQVDDGTAWEIGYACAKGMPVIGLRTDIRLCADSDGGLVNAMIQGSVLDICRSGDEVIGVLDTLRRGMGKP